MTTKEAIDILIRHNEWRRGGDKADSPIVIGAAIDTVCGLRLLTEVYELGASTHLMGRVAQYSMGGHAREKIIEWFDRYGDEEWFSLRDKILKG